MTTKNNTIIVNGTELAFSDERNLLEVIRKAGIEIPTFCYHSELSIYGACRLCIIEVEGRGIMASCSTKPEAGMVVHTDTKQIREIRKINIELLLANHDRECPSCVRSANCTLQDMARRLGVEDVRFKQLEEKEELDFSSPSLTRDPNKCVLCGDCVRVCSEVQGIGAIDFIGRGAKSKVAPAFDQNLNDVECVNCGQCAAVCPTGAIRWVRVAAFLEEPTFYPARLTGHELAWHHAVDIDEPADLEVARCVAHALDHGFAFEAAS